VGKRRFGAELEDRNMRALIAMIVVVYLVGVGVALAPTIRDNWTVVPASVLLTNVSKEMPRALAWPSIAYHSIMAEPEPART
jgi:hypothetical protein